MYSREREMLNCTRVAAIGATTAIAMGVVGYIGSGLLAWLAFVILMAYL